MSASSGGLHVPGGGDPPPGDGAVLLGPDADEALEEAGRRVGLICAGCGGPLDQQGCWEYVTLRPEVREGVPKIITSKAFICGRESCAHVRARLEQSATARRPWQPWHLFDASETPAPQAGPDAEQETYWNGEPCRAERCTVVVADNADTPAYWARPFVGTERQAVMVQYNGETFYIDNEGYEAGEEEVALLKSRGLNAEPKVGYPGWGWDKVTVGRGGPKSPHASLAVERIVSTDHDQSV